MRRRIRFHLVVTTVSGLLLGFTALGLLKANGNATVPEAAETTSSYIVQAESSAAAKKAVERVGGRVTDVLTIINAVGAELDAAQLAGIRSLPGTIKVFPNHTLNVSGNVAETHYPTLVGAAELHAEGITGDGVTLAVIDTGIWKTDSTEYAANGRQRILAQYDATLPSPTSRADWWNLLCRNDDDDDERDDDSYNCSRGDDDDDDDDDDDEDERRFGTDRLRYDQDIDDWNGHGTHVTSIAVGSARTAAGRYQGVAPNANVVAVRAFEPDGSGTYLNVIKALDWIVAHRDRFDIRILNLSFGAAVTSNYWNDPLNQAVMAAWQRGITVVAAAGNGGPGPMTIGVPGNLPYVITVGAMTDSFTPDDLGDDRLATFSAAGPTVEGFVKPDVLAPGGHMLGRMPPYAWLPLSHPEFVRKVDHSFTMSGTSQAAGVVSGVLALMLEADPSLTPDRAKCRLMASARVALREDGEHAYSVFQQGAGRIDAVAAVEADENDCANRGLDLRLDLAGVRHFAGRSGLDQYGTYYLTDESGQRLTGAAFEWQRGSLWRGTAFWQQGAVWGEGAIWSQASIWNPGATSDPDSVLNQGAVWPEGAVWGEGLTKPVSTSVWVENE